MDVEARQLHSAMQNSMRKQSNLGFSLPSQHPGHVRIVHGRDRVELLDRLRYQPIFIEHVSFMHIGAEIRISRAEDKAVATVFQHEEVGAGADVSFIRGIER
jgi:hypothetical protein